MQFNSLQNEMQRLQIDINRSTKISDSPSDSPVKVVHVTVSAPSDEQLDPYGEDNQASELAQVRQRMTSLIEGQLPILACQELRVNTSSRSLATQLEKMLFTKAPSVEAYKDLTTLKVRSQRLLRILLQRRLRQKEQAAALRQKRRQKGTASEEKQPNNSTEEEAKRRPVCTFIYR